MKFIYVLPKYTDEVCICVAKIQMKFIYVLPLNTDEFYICVA